MNILAVTTYNRLELLKRLLTTFLNSIDKNQDDWQLLIADDGSTDGTLEYLDGLKIPQVPITIIKNNRKGIYHQFNTIVNYLEDISFDYCFKCDDDIEFLKPGWDQIYIKAILESGYDHLCYFDTNWRPNKNLNKPIVKNHLISYCRAKDVQGAFFTLTPDVIKKVGYMDTKNFGFRGAGHIDYTMRACRAGFNDINHPFDAKNSQQYIKYQTESRTSALNKHVQNAIENDDEIKRRYELIKVSSRDYIPFNEEMPSFTSKIEKVLLLQRLDALEKEKEWYEETYGHQPRWFVRLGKLINFLKVN